MRRRDLRRPWMRAGEAEFIRDCYLGTEKVCLEWGMGGSTCWFPRFAKSWYAIEHNRSWLEQVAATIERDDLTPIVSKDVKPRRPRFTGPRNPNRCDREFVPRSYEDLARTESCSGWRNYIRGFESFDVGFDFVLVDGRARPECVRAIAESDRLNPRAVIVLHDWVAVKRLRTHYEVVLDPPSPLEIVDVFCSVLVMHRP